MKAQPEQSRPPDFSAHGFCLAFIGMQRLLGKIL